MQTQPAQAKKRKTRGQEQPAGAFGWCKRGQIATGSTGGAPVDFPKTRKRKRKRGTLGSADTTHDGKPLTGYQYFLKMMLPREKVRIEAGGRPAGKPALKEGEDPRACWGGNTLHSVALGSVARLWQVLDSTQKAAVQQRAHDGARQTIAEREWCEHERRNWLHQEDHENVEQIRHCRGLEALEVSRRATALLRTPQLRR